MDNQKFSAMKEGGEYLRTILKQTLNVCKAGKTTLEINNFAQKLIDKTGGEASFKKVKGYQWATCIAINDVVVHGIPKTDVIIQEGDIVGVDVGLYYKGFHTDTSWSIVIPFINPTSKQRQEFNKRIQFLKIGETALEDAIKQVKLNNRIGHISLSIQKSIEGAGFNVVRELVGHGVGEKLHENPEIPGILKTSIEKTPPLVSGMTLAIEIIYIQGKPAIFIDSDGWTIRSKDGTLAGLFEKTIALDKSDIIVLT